MVKTRNCKEQSAYHTVMNDQVSNELDFFHHHKEHKTYSMMNG